MRRPYSSYSESIPRKDLCLPWFHDRVTIPRETIEERANRYNKEHRIIKKIFPFFSRFMWRFHVIRHRWVWYKVIMHALHRYMRLVHRLEVRGRENIPRDGAIFYLLHNGDNDVIYFLSAFKDPVGVFTAIGNGFFADFMEHVYGWVARRGTANVMVEKMARAILKKNHYFVMWPEGSPSRDGHPMEAFSGIVRVYATLNAKRDLVPFVPVLMRGSETYQHHKDKRKWKILVEFLHPIFLPRAWLAEPRNGGKTARETMDKLMLVLARKVGYSSLRKNHALEWRRRSGGRPWGSHD